MLHCTLGSQPAKQVILVLTRFPWRLGLSSEKSYKYLFRLQNIRNGRRRYGIKGKVHNMKDFARMTSGKMFLLRIFWLNFYQLSDEQSWQKGVRGLEDYSCSSSPLFQNCNHPNEVIQCYHIYQYYCWKVRWRRHGPLTAERMFSRRAFLESLFFVTDGSLLCFIVPFSKKLFLTKKLKVRSRQCYLKRRPREANIFNTSLLLRLRQSVDFVVLLLI